VANAGVGSHGSVCDIPLEDIDAMIDVNLKGTIYTARYTVPHLISSQGDFISLASVAGLRAFPGEAVYNASKFGQVGFTRALDHELREHGVRVTNVAPGGIATSFAMGKGRTPDMAELEGMMSAEEVADVVLFAVTRPRGMRMMTMSFRPMSEPSWG
jgi:3-oxoacyl-[acyl-carrier protein] reductase